MVEETRPDAAGPAITIKVDGKPALTIDMVAARHDLTPDNARKILSRARAAGDLQPIAQLDDRTPLYGATAVDRYMANRPGRGRMAESTRRALETMSRPQTHPNEYRVGGTPNTVG